jgi:hypothetical protein
MKRVISVLARSYRYQRRRHMAATDVTITGQPIQVVLENAVAVSPVLPAGVFAVGHRVYAAGDLY